MAEITRQESVAICIATYKRPEGLARLLHSLRELEFHKSKPPRWRIVIVDNDATMPCKDLVDGLKEAFSVPVSYGVELERGIASARNCTIALAGDVEFVAFIDDDEVADPCWLDELLAAQAKFAADVVNGPVLPRFEEPVPAWIIRGRFYDRRRLPTGAKIRWASTGNVLVRTAWLHAVQGPFDEKLNLTRGSDSLLFSKICRLGAQMVWCDEAMVEEYNPPSHVSAKWILRRAHWDGIQTPIGEKLVGYSIMMRMIRFPKSVVRILWGFLLMVPASISSGYAGFIRSLAYVSFGLGEIRGMIGRRHLDYEHTDRG